MATPTTLDMGEPLNERSVDGNIKPTGEESDGGDFVEDSSRQLKGIEEASPPKAFPSPPRYPDYETDPASDISMISPRFSKFYDYDAYHDDETRNEEEEGGTFDILNTKFPSLQLTLSDVLFKIFPSIGAASYEYFSLKITNPAWFLRAFPGRDQTVSNVLWFQAHTGIALYILSRRHFRTMPFSKRLLYGTFGSLLFNYGSCLFWALGRSYLPRIPAVHVAFGLMSGGILLYIGQDYFHYIDNSCSEVD